MSKHLAMIFLALAGRLALGASGHAQDIVRAPDVIVLQGVVTAEESADIPLRSVRVAVTWTGGGTDPVFTDDSGRFSVAIRGSVYHTITATKAGYAPLRVGREPDSPDEPVALRMPKGAVITGSVIDATGAPVPGAPIRIRRTDPSGQTYASGDYQTDTDDRGEFRVGSLPAGRYAVVLATGGERLVLGDAVQPDAVVDLPAGGERAVLRIDPRVPVGGDGATSYAAGFNAQVAAAAPGRGATDTGLVQGRVLDAAGRPVPGILVRAFAVTGGGGPVGASDPAGRFELRNLEAGTYRIVASRIAREATLVLESAGGGVVSARTLRIPDDGPGQIVVIGHGEQLTGVDLTLPRGGVITGHVVDAAGEPLEGVTVHAWTRQRVSGRTVVGPSVVGSFNAPLTRRKTDDRGQFRLFHLPPGSYYLAATESTSGSATDAATGRFVFHPSAVSPAMAVPVAVQDGVEAFASIIIAPGPLSAVEGQAIDESGEPFHGSVRLSARAGDGAQMATMRELLVRDGTFRFTDVPPGEYVVQAVARTVNGNILAALGESGLRFGVAFVSATPDAAASAVIQTGTGSVLQGRVVVEGSPGQPLPMPISVSGVPADPELSPTGEMRRTRVEPDGSFAIAGLFGPIRFAVDLPPGWRLESVYVDGTNAADDPVAFGSARQSRSGVEVVIARGGAEIAGRISGDAGSRAGALVVAGPLNPSQWHAGSRFVRMTTADRDGRFTLSGLPGGQFIVAAIEAATLRPGSGDSLSPEDVHFVMSGATHVSVPADGRTSVTVGVTQLPE